MVTPEGYSSFAHKALGVSVPNDKWFYTGGLVVPALAIFLPTILYKEADKIQALQKLSMPIKAVLVGVIITLICWVLMTYVFTEKNPLQSAVLCGLLAAEVMTFSGAKIPTMAGITLWLFFYFHSVEH